MVVTTELSPSTYIMLDYQLPSSTIHQCLNFTTILNTNPRCFPRLSAAIKGEALGKKNGLPVLKYEKWILGIHDEETECKVPTTLVANGIKARQLAAEITEASDLACFSDIQRVMKAAMGTLLSIDMSFRMELTWLLSEEADIAFAATMDRELLNCFPSAATTYTFAQSVTKMDALLDSEKGKFSSLRSQSNVRTVRRVVAAMLEGVQPGMQLARGGGVFEQCHHRLPYFCVFDQMTEEACAQ